MIKALQNQVLWGAGLDVTNHEPMQKDNLLLNLPNFWVLPHIGSATKETQDQMAFMAAENIIAALNELRIPQIINEDVYMK